MYRAPTRAAYPGIGTIRSPYRTAPRHGVRVRPPSLRERAARWAATARLVWRWLCRLSRGVLVVAMAVAGWRALTWLSDPARFPLATVEITGDLDHIDRQALEQRLLPAAAGGFFGLDVAAVADAAEDAPWVKRALVRRVWPNKLVVEIVGQRALARWGDDGLLSDSGEIFAASGTTPSNLPRLSAPAGARPLRVFADYKRFSRLLEGLPPVREVHQEARGAWRIGLDDGLVIIVGRRDVDKRLARFADVYRSRLVAAMPPLERVDLRYADGFAVRFKSASEPDRRVMDL
ncbi:MAG: cell division protein FtsQ/DivIB [Immundisolibacter sp.]